MTADVCDWCGTDIRLKEQGGWLAWSDRHGDADCSESDDGEHEPAP